MPFKKGKPKTGGRRKGTPNAVSLTLREQVQNLLEGRLEQISIDLEALEAKDRVNAWIKLLDFAVPKLQRTETIIDLANLTPEDIDRLFDRAINQTACTK